MNEKEFLDYLDERERKSDRQMLGCAGVVSLLLLAFIAIVFVGCPAAVSYGVSRGCASVAEHER
jgi:Tfp pilus assembly protein PilN